MAETIVNKEHKDRLFTLLFGRNENRAWTLELYNAINGSHYDRPEDIEITTMEDAIYMGMKNDVSYILNEELLDSCKPLAEYSWFINEIRNNQKELGYEIETAVDRAIDEMPGGYVIKTFLLAHRAEVKMSCLTEYNEAETMELFKEEYLKRGREEAKVDLIRNMLISRTPEEIAKFCGFPLELVEKISNEMTE